MPETTDALKQRFNQARLMELMEEEDLAAVVSVSPENVTYTSGYHNIDMIVLREEVHAVVWPREGQPAFLVPDRANDYTTFIDDLRRCPPYGPPDRAIRTLAEIIREKGLGGERVGIELDYLTAHKHGVLTEMLPDITWVEASGLLERVRCIKTPAEIELLRDAA